MERHADKVLSKPGTVHAAAEVGDIKRLQEHVREAIASGTPESVSLQLREDILGMMPVHVACEHGQLEVVEFLISKRVDLDAGDFFRVTGLHLAAVEDHYEIVRVLLEARANVKPADSEGDLPIHWAATKGHMDVIELLVQKRSPIDVVNNAGWTPLHRAAYNGRKQAVLMLCKLGANLGATNKDGNTALHLACFMNHLGVIEVLLTCNAKQDIRNVRNQDPFDLCITDAARDILRQYGYGYDHVEFENKGHAVGPGGEISEAAVAGAKRDAVAGNFNKLTIDPLARKKILVDGFPDQPSPTALATPHTPDALVPSGFLSEASQGFGDKSSPYRRA